LANKKSNKELGYLHDLFIATDWGERFAGMVDEHVKLPNQGRALYVAAGTGGHTLALQERAGIELKFLGVDENQAYLEVSRAKAALTKGLAEFRREKLDQLSFQDDEFDFVIGDGSLVAPERIRTMLSEMVRVARPDAIVALTLPTFSSFSEFFSIYWEVIHSAGFEEHEVDVESLITQLATIAEIEESANHEGLKNVTSETQIEEFHFASGKDFLNAPLISHFLLVRWLQSLPRTSHRKVSNEIARLIDAERHKSDFALTIKATLMIGRKMSIPLVG
jgi:ubiquinone/menaquinone biosynthesis C-methylase UbiE